MLSKFIKLIKAITGPVSNEIKTQQHTIFLGVCFLLVSMISYNIGKINAFEKKPIKVLQNANIFQSTNTNSSHSQSNLQIQNTKHKINTDLRVVASKKSTSKKYHYLWCQGAKQIKEENKKWFDSENEALKAGYILAGNCTK